MKRIATCLLLFSVFYCVTPNYVTNITSYQKVQHLNKKTVTVVGLDRVFIHNYEKTFHKNYQNDTDFANAIARQFAGSLEASSTFHEAKYDFSDDWNHVNTMASKKSYLKVQELLKECTTDYLIILDEFELKKMLNSNTTYSGGDINNGQMTTTTEMIHLSAKVKMFDVKTHDPIIDFDVYGEDQVFLFSYSSSLMDAKDKMVAHALEFLANHKK